MFPIGDDNPQINKPIAVYLLIGLNAAAWFLLQGMGFGEQLQTSVCQYGVVPSELFGQMPNDQIYCPDNIGWPGVISSMFMHGSWMHILGNMWFLWVFGDNVEDAMGSVRFGIFYVVCGLCAAAANIAADTGSSIPMVGASGAIGGVMGAYIMLYPKVKVRLLVILIIIITTFRVPAIAMLGYWIVIQVIGGISSIGATGGGVAFWAHVGGFAAGASLVWLFKDDELLVNHPYYGWRETKKSSSIWDDPDNRQ